MLCKQYSSSTIGHEISGVSRKTSVEWVSLTNFLVMRGICRLRDHLSVKAMTLRSTFMPITKIFV